MSASLTPDVHAKLKDMAKRNQRSVAGEVRYLLEQYVRDHEVEEMKDGA